MSHHLPTEGVAVPNVDDALSTVEAYHRAWTSGDEGQIVEIRLAFDRLGYVPREQRPA